METRFLDQKTEMEKCEEGQEIFDLKPLTKEEIAWLEEHFMDFVREQYLVKQEDMREALKIARIPEGTIEIELKRILKLQRNG